MPKPFRYIALIAAAGVGTRLGNEVPKQYVRLGARTILEHSIYAMLSDMRIDRVFVVVAPGDERWRSVPIDNTRVEFLAVGGASRAASVLNGLNALTTRTHDDDHVLVHDAARPCLGTAELARLIEEAAGNTGGLLALPLADTLKRADGDHVAETLPRSGVWCAQTPQMFRVGLLRAALSTGPLDDITDEASAIERQGGVPRLVPGAVTNIKVTTQQDLALAEAILSHRERST